MQVARNFFLSREKTLTRKLYEALLAFKIENSLGKDQILEIYINQIYLGQRAYGFGAAAQVYFGKSLSQLNPAEIAMLAGLPKAPSSFNPVINPKRAKQRQLYVLRRMHELALHDDERYEKAQKTPISVKREAVTEYEIHAEFVAEMVRQLLYERYPEEVYSRGFRVYTTISRVDQEAAYAALRQGLLEYDRRHGYRGPEGFVDLKDAQEEDYEEILQDHPDSDDLLAALVLEATPKRVTAYRRGGETVTVSGEGLKFAERMLDSRTPPTRRIRRGAVIRIQKDDHDDWQIVQLPETEGAFISVNPQYAQDYITRFGFDADRHPPYLTMALGAGSATPLQMARAFSVFATGGYRTEPYVIQKVVDDRGNVLAQAQPARAGDESLRVIDGRNAFIMDSMMHDVMRYGTGARAMILGRQDLAGKSGTTNDYIDAWFSGYQPTLVGIAWVGFDQPKKLGPGETGSVTALPIWMSYMAKALKGTPEMVQRNPEGVVMAKVNENGLQSPDGRPEFFFRENVPPEQGPIDPGVRTTEDARNQLF